MGLFAVTMLAASVALAGERDDAQVLSFQVRSEYRLEDAEAIQEAQERFSVQVVRLLAAHGPCRDEGFLRRILPGLLQATPEVELCNTAETADKPYGQLHRRIITARLPYLSLSRWASRIATERQARLKYRMVAICLMVAVCAVSGGIAVVLDRWTRGYRRGTVTVLTILMMLCEILLAAIPLCR